MEAITEPFETEEYKGYTIEIYPHCSGITDPRDDDDCNSVKIILDRQRNESDVLVEDYGSWEEVEKAIEKEYGKSVILPVYKYEHSIWENTIIMTK